MFYVYHNKKLLSKHSNYSIAKKKCKTYAEENNTTCYVFNIKNVSYQKPILVLSVY